MMAGLEDELGDVIAKARAGSGLTPHQLAQATGVSEKEVQDLESCRFTPSSHALARLAEALSLDRDKLEDIAHARWHPAASPDPSDDILLARIHVGYGAYGSNCYVVGCRASQAAAVIDPGGEVEAVDRTLVTANLKPEVALITHGHHDHTGGLSQMVERWPELRVYSHPAERSSLPAQAQGLWHPAEEGLRLALGHLSVDVRHTPGHTAGSTCYMVDGFCFVGDTLFAGSIGRLGAAHGRAQEGLYRQMLAHIRAKVLSLPPSTRILPGHGPATTVGEELAHNPFF